jgi:hypothetical protein
MPERGHMFHNGGHIATRGCRRANNWFDRMFWIYLMIEHKRSSMLMLAKCEVHCYIHSPDS